MNLFISNGHDVYNRVTDETEDYYVCTNILYPKSDVIEDLHPQDEVPAGKLYLHIVPFVNY